jgi:hypothetical protein
MTAKPEYMERLRTVVDDAAPRLRALGDASAAKPASGGWSPREIIGHLVDSATNNHRRFVVARFQDDLVFPGYEQDVWVKAGAYRTRRGTISWSCGGPSTCTSLA